MTPFEIDILLHYYTTPLEHDVVARNPPIWPDTIKGLIAEGLLEVRAEDDREHGGTYRATERTRAYIEALCAMPLPVQKWVMPDEA